MIKFVWQAASFIIQAWMFTLYRESSAVTLVTYHPKKKKKHLWTLSEILFWFISGHRSRIHTHRALKPFCWHMRYMNGKFSNKSISWPSVKLPNYPNLPLDAHERSRSFGQNLAQSMPLRWLQVGCLTISRSLASTEVAPETWRNLREMRCCKLKWHDHG